MNGTTLAELLEHVAEKAEKDVAKVCIVLARQYDERLARDIAEKYGVDLESIE